jgi:general secretion pathway protein L
MISERVSSLPSPIVVLEVLSRLLPDGVWLTGLSLQGDTLSITGFAREPARLIPLLEQSPHFAEVAFRAPSTQTTVRVADGRDMSLERFSLAARVEQLWEP